MAGGKSRIIRKSTAIDATPFAGLSPDVVLDAAASAGCDTDGGFFALNSYENRVYQLGHGPGASVLKFYRPARWLDDQVLEEHAFAIELASAELPVSAPVSREGRTLFMHEGFRFAVFPWLAGRPPELDTQGAREVLGRTIGRIHRIGSVRPFSTRPKLSVERLGVAARNSVLRCGLLPEQMREQYERASDALLTRVQGVFHSAGAPHLLRIHGDCHLGNLLWNEQGPVFVDLDDCLMGPAIQDLWMVLSGAPAEQQRQWQELLEGLSPVRRFRLPRAVAHRAAAGPAYDASRGLDRSALDRPRVSARLSMVRRSPLLGSARRGPARAVSGNRRAALVVLVRSS